MKTLLLVLSRSKKTSPYLFYERRRSSKSPLSSHHTWLDLFENKVTMSFMQRFSDYLRAIKGMCVNKWFYLHYNMHKFLLNKIFKSFMKTDENKEQIELTLFNPWRLRTIFKNPCRLNTRNCRLLLNDSLFRNNFFETAAFSILVLAALSKFLFL